MHSTATHGRESSSPKCWGGGGSIDPERLCQRHKGECSASLSEALICLCDLQTPNLSGDMENSALAESRFRHLWSPRVAGWPRPKLSARQVSPSPGPQPDSSSLGPHMPSFGLFQQYLNLQKLIKYSLIPSSNMIEVRLMLSGVAVCVRDSLGLSTKWEVCREQAGS